MHKDVCVESYKTANGCTINVILNVKILERVRFEDGVYDMYEHETSLFRQRPYHAEHTGSRLITAVKQRWARLVLGWVTAWEHRVLLAFFLLFIFLFHTPFPLLF